MLYAPDAKRSEAHDAGPVPRLGYEDAADDHDDQGQ